MKYVCGKLIIILLKCSLSYFVLFSTLLLFVHFYVRQSLVFFHNLHCEVPGTGSV